MTVERGARRFGGQSRPSARRVRTGPVHTVASHSVVLRSSGCVDDPALSLPRNKENTLVISWFVYRTEQGASVAAGGRSRCSRSSLAPPPPLGHAWLRDGISFLEAWRLPLHPLSCHFLGVVCGGPGSVGGGGWGWVSDCGGLRLLPTADSDIAPTSSCLSIRATISRAFSTSSPTSAFCATGRCPPSDAN